MSKVRDEARRLDEAARAGWLYYVAGNTQDQIAAKLGVSRQAAQRLVSQSVSAGLVKVRIDHPLAACLDLEKRLEEAFGLRHAQVVPSDPAAASTTLGIAEACAARLERELSAATPKVVGLGTGRTLRTAVERMGSIRCPQHRIVSLTGNIGPDGTASVYNVIFSLADKVEAPHYPMPLPVVAGSIEERRLLQAQPAVQASHRLAAEADVAFVGIGELGAEAPLLKDRFITPAERSALAAEGGIGEIIGWVFDAGGRILDCDFNRRVVSTPIPSVERTRVVGVAMGQPKEAGILAAMRGRLIDGLITDERTAERLLAAAAGSRTSHGSGGTRTRASAAR